MTGETPPASTPGTPLVGHEHERAVLGEALARCREGAGGVLLLHGEAGVGKTRLVTDALRRWDGDRHDATATPGTDPLAAFTGLLAGGEAPTPERVLDVLAARQRPAVVLLDDLHWADAATVDLLPDVDRALVEAPVLVVGVYRSDELPRAHPLRRARAELRRARRLRDVAVRPLALEETGDLLAALLGGAPHPGLLAAVHERTDGLPFFVEEVAGALVDGGALVERDGRLALAPDAGLPLPEGVVDAVLARTERIREEQPDAVAHAAVLGVRVDLPALVELSDPGGVDALLDAGLLLEVEDGVASFRHALVRESLYRSLPWAQRRAAHRRTAEVLECRGAPPVLVADHWVAAHEPDRARPLLLEAADRSCRLHAWRDAATAARRALALWPEDEDPDDRFATLEHLAECVEHTGDHAEVAGIWAELARRRRVQGEAGAAARAHRRAANAAELLGDQTTCATHRAAAAAAFTEAGDHGDAAAEHLSLAGQLRAAGRLSAALEQADAARAAAERGERCDLGGQALALQGVIRAALGHGVEGVELARQGLQLALSDGLSERVGEIYYEVGEALEYAADYASAVAAYESAFEVCRSHGYGELAQICFVCTSPVARLMGDWDRSLEICTEVLADEDASALTRHVAEEEVGLIVALRGNARKARGRLRRAVEFGQANGIFGLEVGARWGLAVVADLEQDPATAAVTLADLVERCRTTEECHYALPALRWAASHRAAAGDVEAVRACHAVVAAAATRNSAPKVLSALAHVGAELAALEEDPGQAGVLFARSLDLLEGITAPYERAHTQVRSGLAAAAAGDREAATHLLAAGQRIARRLGARPLVQQAGDALTALGAGVERRAGRTAAAAGPTGLTRREGEVLAQLVTGRTNRDIAAALFLSTRTVDMHVRNILAKLDCSSRAMAVRRATDLGLVPARPAGS